MPIESLYDERPLHDLAVSSCISTRARRAACIKRRKVDPQQSSLSHTIPDHSTVFSSSSASVDRSQVQDTEGVNTAASAPSETLSSLPTSTDFTPSSSRTPAMPTRTLVPIVVCVVLAGIVGAVLAIWYARRRRRQQQRRIQLRLGQSEMGALNEDDEPAIWDNRPPATTPIPPPRSVYSYKIDISEYSPTATVFSPTAIAFPPAALEKPTDSSSSKGYERYSHTYAGSDSAFRSPPQSPPRSPPRIVVDQWDLDDARISLYSVESFYPPASPVPSSETGMGTRAISPTVLDTFPAPPPLAHPVHRGTSTPGLRPPSVDASAHGANSFSTSSEGLAPVPAMPPSRRMVHRTSESLQFAHRHVVVTESSFDSFPGPDSSHIRFVHNSSPRKKRTLQSSRNSLDIIRERGSL